MNGTGSLRTAGQAAGGELGYRRTYVLIAGYLFIGVAANLSVLKATPLFGDYLIPVGSLLYAVSFSWIDLVNRHLGKAAARWLVLVGVAANFFLVAWLSIYIAVPGNSDWSPGSPNQEAIELVLGSVPRILFASLLTNLITENLDITLFHLLSRRFPTSPLWLRSVGSNSVSAPLDGFLFAVLALGGTVPADVLTSIVISSMVYKLIVSCASSPILYLFARKSAATPETGES